MSVNRYTFKGKKKIKFLDLIFHVMGLQDRQSFEVTCLDSLPSVVHRTLKRL